MIVAHCKNLRIREHLGYAVAQLVEADATSLKVAGSIPGGFLEFFYSPNPSGRAVTLG